VLSSHENLLVLSQDIVNNVRIMKLNLTLNKTLSRTRLRHSGHECHTDLERLSYTVFMAEVKG